MFHILNLNNGKLGKLGNCTHQNRYTSGFTQFPALGNSRKLWEIGGNMKEKIKYLCKMREIREIGKFNF